MLDDKRKRIKRTVITICIAIPLLWLIFGPFPGMGMYFPIRDALRGHPEGKHGTQPAEFIGFWLQEEPEEYGFDATAFMLLEDSNVTGGGGMSFTRWHVDNGSFFGDTVSGCGNCYAGNRTGEYEFEFDGDDRMKLTQVEGSYNLRYGGWYQRIEITKEFVSEMEELKESDDNTVGGQARWALLAIEGAHRRGLDVPATSLCRD